MEYYTGIKKTQGYSPQAHNLVCLFTKILRHTKGRLKKSGSSLPELMLLFQSIVTSYAGLIIDDTVEILGALSPEDEASTELWHRVVRTLSKTFEHDQDGKPNLA